MVSPNVAVPSGQGVIIVLSSARVFKFGINEVPQEVTGGEFGIILTSPVAKSGEPTTDKIG